MSHQSYTIFGRVHDASSEGVPAVTITLDTTDPDFGRLDAHTYSTTSDAEGNYELAFSSEMMTEMFTDLAGNFRDDEAIGVVFTLTSQARVVGRLTRRISYVDICFGAQQDLLTHLPKAKCCCPPPPSCTRRTVHGRVFTSTGALGANLVVRLFRKNFRNDDELASTSTDDRGRYTLHYLEGEECDPSGAELEIFATAESTDDPPVVLSRSRLIVGPRVQQNLDLHAVDGVGRISEYTRVAEGIAAVMGGSSPYTIGASSLQAHDLDYLEARSELPRERIARFLRARALHDVWANAPVPTGVDGMLITDQVLYAWLEAFGDFDFRALAGRGQADLTRALANGVEREIIEAVAIPQGVESDAHYGDIAEVLVRTYYWDVVDDETRPLGKLLGMGAFAGTAEEISASKRAFVAAYRQRTGTAAEFFAAYQDTQLDAQRLQLQITLAGIVGGDLELTERLLNAMPTPSMETVRMLARRSHADWLVELDGHTLPARLPGDTDPERESYYATALCRAFEHAYSEVAIIENWCRALDCASATPCTSSDLILGVCPCDLRSIVESTPSFTLRHGNVDVELMSFVPSNGSDPSPLTAMKLVQRLYAIAPSFDAAPQIRALIDGGVHSAAQVVAMGEQAFVEHYGNAMGGTDAARLAFSRASMVDDTVHQLVAASSTALSPQMMGLRPRAITAADDTTPPPSAGPSLDELFGSFDACHCLHCNSILGPAAYLTDLLQYIGEDGREHLGCTCDTTPEQERRRPDICAIELDCDNATTAMPQIDLVNELLEERVAWANGVSSDLPSARQTTWSEAQLATHPEHLGEVAYAALRGTMARGAAGHPHLAALRSWVLPFDLQLEEARGYLEQAGVPLAELVEAFVPDGASKDVRRVREALALNAPEYALLVDAQPVNPSLATQPATMAWLGDPSMDGYDSGTERFRFVRAFVAATGLDTFSAFEVVDSHWAGRLGAKQVRIDLSFAEQDPCDLSTAKFEHVVPDSPTEDEDWHLRLSRCHRFVRLYRHLQRTHDGRFALSVHELDECIVQLSEDPSAPEIDPGMLARLAELQTFQRRFPKVSVLKLLSWWGQIQARPDLSTYPGGVATPFETFYRRIITASSTDASPDLRAALEVVHNDADGTLELAGDLADLPLHAPGSSLDFIPVIAAAFRVTPEELLELTGDLPLDVTVGTGAPALTLDNLSELHRRCSFARALDLTPADVLAWEGLCGISLSSPADLTVFPLGVAPALIAAIDAGRTRGLTSHDVDYLLHGTALPEAAIDEVTVHRMVVQGISLASRHAAAQPDSLAALSSTGDLQQKFSRLVELLPVGSQPIGHILDPEKLAVIAQGVVGDGTGAFDEESEWKAYVDDSLDEYHRRFFRRPGVDPTSASLYSDVLGLDLADVAPGTSPEELAGARAHALATPMLNFLSMQSLAPMLAEVLAPALELEPDHARALLEGFESRSLVVEFAQGHVEAGVDPTLISALEDVRDDEAFMADIGALPADAGTLVSDLRGLVHRALRGAALARHFELTTGIMSWMAAAPSQADAIAGTHAEQLNLLAPTRVGLGTHVYADLNRLMDFLDAVRSGLTSELAFPAMLSASLSPTKTDATQLGDGELDSWARQGNWDDVDVHALSGAAGPRPLTYGQLRDFTSFSELQHALRLRAFIDLPITSLSEWLTMGTSPATGEVSATSAGAIKDFVRSRHGEAIWAKVAAQLRDQLRARQRDALMAYVEDYFAYDRDHYDLYGWLLIDPEMSACAPTSRIKSATTSIQQLVSRLHLDHEPTWPGEPTPMRPDAREQWPWRKQYRVWEAQRKVFLHPENWLDPQLRDDATELFEQFERAFRGDELTPANIEKAVAGYLRGLEEVARLEVCGVYHELEHAEESGQVLRDVLHVFARTRGVSGTLFYRTKANTGASRGWSAWQKLPFEVDATDLLPVVFNRRMMLFWLRSESRADTREADDSETPADTHHRVSLAWSTLQFGQWTAPTQSRDALIAVTFRDADFLERMQSITPEAANTLIAVSLSRLEELRQFTRVENPEALRMEHEFTADGRLLVHLRYPTAIPMDFRSGHPGYFEFGGCDGDAHVVPVHDWEYRTPKIEKFKPKNARERGQRWLAHGGIRLSDYGDVIFSNQNPRRAFETINPRPFHALADQPWRQTFYQDDHFNLHIHEGARNADGTWATIGSLGRALSGSILEFLEPGIQRSGGVPSPDLDPDLDPPDLHELGLESYLVEAFHHPYACLLNERVAAEGVRGIYRPAETALTERAKGLIRQEKRDALVVDCLGDETTPFAWRSCPDAPAAPEIPDPHESGAGLVGETIWDRFEFAAGSAYGAYNWEVFYHIPVFVGRELAARGDFAGALEWLGHVFDPSAHGLGMDEVDHWRFGPFRDEAMSIRALLEALANDSKIDELENLRASIFFSQSDPFNPHGVARLRTTPYQLAVVFDYITVLLDWGDQEFRQATRESVTHATTLYGFAQSILGPRPQELPRKSSSARDYCSLSFSGLDETGNSLVEIENLVPVGALEPWTPYPVNAQSQLGALCSIPIPVALTPFEDRGTTPALACGGRWIDPPTGVSVRARPQKSSSRAITWYSRGDDETLYFCVPQNDKLSTYWGTVEDRLYKIRQCLDINGQPLKLELFAAPIDPGALVAAVARAGDLSGIWRQLNAPPPIYRFSTHLRVAKTLAKELESLGATLLSALEKRDAEQLAQLRAGQQVEVLEQVDRMYTLRVDEATEHVSSLKISKEGVEARIRFYEEREFRSSQERTQTALMGSVSVLQGLSERMSTGAAIANLVPNFRAGAEGLPGSPVVTAKFGGSNVAGSMSAMASAMAGKASTLGSVAQNLGTSARLERRDEDWDNALAEAARDLERVSREVDAAESRLDAARGELERHRLARAQAEQVEAFMTARFTNSELYSWMRREISTLMFRCYQVAHDFAQRALASFELELRELPVESLEFGTWDASHGGLLCGERLTAQLRRLEAEYHDRHDRDLELHETIALSQLDASALEQLRATGYCEFHVPEALFDIAHAGHYDRRIKSLRVSMPCTRPGLANIPATVQLLRSKVRTQLPAGSPSTAPEEYEVDSASGTRSIALSSGDRDSGLFALDMSDPRLLPFEYKGAISTWSVRLPAALRGFDYASISDVVFDLQYTARDGGEGYRQAVLVGLPDALATPASDAPVGLGGPILHGLSVRDAYPVQWSNWVAAPIGEASPGSPLVVEDIVRRSGITTEGDSRVHVAFVFEGGTTQAEALTVEVDGVSSELEVSPDVPGDDHRITADADAFQAGTRHELRARVAGQIMTPGQRALLRDIILFIRHSPTSVGA